MARDIDSADDDDDECGHDEQGGDQAQFLADDGKDEVRVMLGNKSQFLPAIAESEPGPATGAEGEHGLVGLIARA